MARKHKTNYWKSALKYLYETRSYIYLIIAVFVFSAFIGFAFPDIFGIFVEEWLKGIIDKTTGLNAFELIIFIFGNNIQSAFLSIVLGIFLGIFPVFIALTNGIVLGYVSSKAAAADGFSVLWSLAPHGVFELPAIFISLGLGARLGMFVFSDNKLKEFKHRLYQSLIIFFLVIIPLLVIAAVIEGLLIAAYR